MRGLAADAVVVTVRRCGRAQKCRIPHSPRVFAVRLARPSGNPGNGARNTAGNGARNAAGKVTRAADQVGPRRGSR